MAYIADMTKATALIGQLVCDGQCVTFVHKCTIIPADGLWKQGAKVRGNRTLAVGTIIAVFDPNGRYANHTDGRSHAAVYVGQDAAGIQVLDQWKGKATSQPIHKRTIRFKGGHGERVDDGDQFSVVQ